VLEKKQSEEQDARIAKMADEVKELKQQLLKKNENNQSLLQLSQKSMIYCCCENCCMINF
jgi:hypothetical protein